MTPPNMPTPMPHSNSLGIGRSVLIVDDEPVIRIIARTTLSTAGFQVSEAGDLQAALAAMQQAAHPFDLLLLDLSLGDTRGVDMIPRVRQLSPTTRILVFSGLDAADVEGLGVDGFLSKPFTRTTLMIAVWQSLARWEETKRGSN